MYRELRIAVVALCGVVLIYFALGSFLPSTWSVQSEQVMPAPKDRVLPLLSDFRSWQTWTTVAGTERSDTKVEVEGDAATVGHLIRWRSNSNEAALWSLIWNPPVVLFMLGTSKFDTQTLLMAIALVDSAIILALIGTALKAYGEYQRVFSEAAAAMTPQNPSTAESPLES